MRALLTDPSQCPSPSQLLPCLRVPALLGDPSQRPSPTPGLPVPRLLAPLSALSRIQPSQSPALGVPALFGDPYQGWTLDDPSWVGLSSVTRLRVRLPGPCALGAGGGLLGLPSGAGTPRAGPTGVQGRGPGSSLPGRTRAEAAA